MKFTPEHEALRKTVRDFVEKEINPHCDEWEAAGEFPIHELFKKLGNLGILGIQKPEEYGGMGLDEGLCEALRESLAKMKGMDNAKVVNHPDSIYAGAIGAALWGAFRFDKLAASGQLLKAS